MIIVKIEPHSAVTGKVSEIGRCLISNSLTGSRTRGDYLVQVLRRGSPGRVQRSGRVLGHPRLSASVWQLVRKALEATGF